ncbi:MAG TPA: ankyrin repeat domain-containing protein [Chitinispirillaceae bacterium]|jgi:ankyrin repeat protein|nr:ankyrin repeat domain-containing protein [Chitinispirillaceae bacterium]
MSLIRSSAKGDLASVKKLVNEGADINAADANGRTALIEAAWGGHNELVKFLIEKKADVNAADNSGYTALMRAAEEGHNTVVANLIKAGANVNCKGKVRGATPLMLAAERGHVKILEVLIANGANVNEIDLYEETALTKAYNADQTKAAQFLESKGGRGKPERSSYTSSYGEKESKTSIKVTMPQWTAAAYESDYDEEDTSESFEED